jgi:hypothetical protein
VTAAGGVPRSFSALLLACVPCTHTRAHVWTPQGSDQRSVCSQGQSQQGPPQSERCPGPCGDG